MTKGTRQLLGRGEAGIVGALITMSLLACAGSGAQQSTLADPSGSETPPTAAPQASGAWGPLAVVAETAGREARTRGTLRLSEVCAIMEDPDGTQVLLVWPGDRTIWDEVSRTITVRSLGGVPVLVADGSVLTFTGGGSSIDEDGLPVDAWLESLDWQARPDGSCPMESRWLVGEIDPKI